MGHPWRRRRQLVDAIELQVTIVTGATNLANIVADRRNIASHFTSTVALDFVADRNRYISYCSRR